MSVTPRKHAQLEKVLAHGDIQQAITLEPVLRTILEIAADPEPRENRWVAYEALKRMSQPYVGFDARCVELRTCERYEMMIAAIDQLLPVHDEETHQWINA